LEHTAFFKLRRAVLTKTSLVASSRRIRELGVEELLCWMNCGALPQDQALRSMRLYAEKVMLKFR
jgi:hypothetical protein